MPQAVTRRTALGTLAAASLLRPQATRRPPNIIVLLADDLGYGDLGCYGQERIRTPHLDRMASEGIRFRQAYAGSTVCAPSRSCLMTGQHTGHTRVRGNSPRTALQPADRTLPELLQRAGYRTGLFGKWGLGFPGTTGRPLDKGFDEFCGYLDQVHAHESYPEHIWDGEREVMLPENMGGPRQRFVPDLVADRALRFVEQNAERPFFLYWATTIPHANNERGKATGMGIDVPSMDPYAGETWPEVERRFAALVTRLDGQVGRLMERLRASSLDRDTIVLFTSDNGPHREGGHDPDFFRSSGPLRGIKRDLYEGGIRVPALAWGGPIKPNTVSDHPWAFWDVLPTCCDLARTPKPDNIDGLSFTPALHGESAPKHEAFYWEFHEAGFHQAVREGNWKLVRQGKPQRTELFDLAADLGEKTDIAARHADVVRRLTARLTSMRTQSREYPV